MNRLPPKPLEITLGVFQNFKSRCNTGINDTGGKFAAGVAYTGGKFATGINSTDGKFETALMGDSEAWGGN
jgi:hypothetical protein